MKISCLQENLHKALSVVSHGIGKETGLPILSNVLIKTEGGFVTLSATNLEIGIHAVVRGKVEQEGVIAVDGRILADYIGLLPKEKIELEVVDGVLSIQCQNYSTKIKGSNADDFPILPTIERTQSITCNAEELKKAIQGTIFTATIQETRPELNGLLFQFLKEESTLSIVGTDAYRLAKRVLPVESTLKDTYEVIIPLKTLQELLRILGSDVSGQVELYVSENQILFISEGIELLSKIIHGSYPDYQQIIPSSFSSEVLVDSKEWVKAVKVSSIFSKSGLYDIHLSLRCVHEDQGEMEISAANTTVGENTTTLPIHWRGGENEVTLNYKYLLEGLQSFDDEKILFGMIDANNPCIIRPQNNQKILYLIMPIRE